MDDKTNLPVSSSDGEKKKTVYQELLESCATKKEAEELLSYLSHVQNNLFFSQAKNEDATAQAVDLQKNQSERNIEEYLSQELASLLKSYKISFSDVYQFSAFCRELTQEYTKIPVLMLYVPIPVSERFMRELSRMLAQTGRHILLETKVDKSLLAGAALGFGGYYKDYSLRKKFQKFISDLTF